MKACVYAAGLSALAGVTKAGLKSAKRWRMYTGSSISAKFPVCRSSSCRYASSIPKQNQSPILSMESVFDPPCPDLAVGDLVEVRRGNSVELGIIGRVPRIGGKNPKLYTTPSLQTAITSITPPIRGISATFGRWTMDVSVIAHLQRFRSAVEEPEVINMDMAARWIFKAKDERLSNVAWLAKDLNSGKPRPCKLKYWQKVDARVTWSKSLPQVDCLNHDGTLKTHPPNYFPPDVTFDKDDKRYNEYLWHSVFSNSEHNNPFSPLINKVVLDRLLSQGRNMSSNMVPMKRQYDSIQAMKDFGLLHAWENTAMLPSPRDPKGVVPWLEGHGLNEWSDLAVQYMEEWADVLLAGPKLDHGKEVAGDQIAPRKLKTPRFSASGEKTIVGQPFTSVTTELRHTVVFPKEAVSDSFNAVDPCASIRKDFGHLPVYVIDSPTARELDDGISVETRDDGEWLHVHIADPTAYLPSNHPLAMLAQLRGSSGVPPERHYPLIPDKLTRNDGEILDYDVKPSFVSNVKILHYRNVNEVLSWKNVFGMDLPQHQRSVWVDGVMLRKLQKIARSHMLLRTRRGGFVSDQPGLGVSVEPNPIPPARLGIDLLCQTMQHVEPATGLVSECMIIAGRVAAAFCQEMKVPAVYRGHENLLARLPEEAKAGVDSAIACIDLKSGVMPYSSFRKILPFFAPATMSMSPIEHFSMGIHGGSTSALTGYVKNDGTGKRIRRLSVASDRFWALEWIRRREILWRAGATKSIVHGPRYKSGDTWTVLPAPMPPTGFGPRQARVWGQTIEIHFQRLSRKIWTVWIGRLR
ncbi:hypothetical protein BC829DRAFT_441338 [Chytridium lagenaria]|nr:hypothetical protein BC829DRAFT_441338 [Chytridium lagenaria]